MCGLFLCLASLISQNPAARASHEKPKAAGVEQARHDLAAQAQIKLALASEARGMEAERAKHLAQAVLMDPANPMARGLLGMVAFQGRWLPPEEIGRRIQDDEALTARLAQYESRRAEVLKVAGRLLDREAIEAALRPYRDELELYVEQRRVEMAQRSEKAARAHMELALWCEKAGLEPEARAHFTEASQLAPHLRTPWEHLGFKKHNGRWATEEMLAAGRREAEAQRHADRHWEPLLRRWKGWLDQPPRRREAEDYLAKLADPRAVPSVWKVFGQGDARDRRRAVALLRNLDSPLSTLALVLLAVRGEPADVRETATDALMTRDSRDVISFLVDRLQSPLKYRMEAPKGFLDYMEGSKGVLVIEGESSIYKRSYRGGDIFAQATLGEARVDSIVAPILAARLNRDVHDVELHNEAARRQNERISAVLQRVTGQALGSDANVWRKWWADQQGYVYEPMGIQEKHLVAGEFKVELPFVHTACFAAGTLVTTLTGPRPIETLQIGDRVLAQDTRTGALSYQPVLVAHHNPPSPTLRLALGDGETIVATGIHRFWKIGRGWVMARDLKPGDLLRIVGGTVKVEGISAGPVQPVYNLDVERDRDFFVGKAGILVHDFSLVDAVPEPFDSLVPAGRTENGTVSPPH